MPRDYFAPTNLDEAVSLMAAGGVCPVAGGTDFFPTLGEAPVKTGLLDLTRIPSLQGISRTEDGYRFGAVTTWTEIADANLPPAFAGLQAAARVVGGVQIQNAGTIAGNLCNASPAADGVPPLLTLDAQVELAAPAGHRRVPLESFLLGPRQTAKAPDELVTGVLIPRLPDGAVAAFEKLGSRTHLVISIVMTAVVLVLEQGRIAEARVAVGAAGPVAKRLTSLEATLQGQDPRDIEVGSAYLSALTPIDDVRADAAYRYHAVAEQIARAIRSAARG